MKKRRDTSSNHDVHSKETLAKATNIPLAQRPPKADNLWQSKMAFDTFTVGAIYVDYLIPLKDTKYLWEIYIIAYHLCSKIHVVPIPFELPEYT